MLCLKLAPETCKFSQERKNYLKDYDDMDILYSPLIEWSHIVAY